MHFSFCFLCYQINKGLLFFSKLLKCKGIFSSSGGISNTKFGMSHRLSNQRISDNFLQGLHKNARISQGCLFRTPLMECLTDVADVKMLVEIRSPMNNFIGDFFKFRNNAYLIILTCILLISLHSGMLFSTHTLRKLTSRKLAKFMKLKSTCRCFN